MSVTSLSPLVNEAHLGERLGRDLQQGKGADFRLWLALLDERVETQPWFAHRRASAPQASLRDCFELPPETPLSDAKAPDTSHWTDALQSEAGCMTDIRLALALRPQPLKGATPQLEPEVYLNLSAYARERLTAGKQDATEPSGGEPLKVLALLDRLAQGVDTGIRRLD